MAYFKKYSNLKMLAGSYPNVDATGVVGPQTLNAATTYYTSPVPCKGAVAVEFRFTSTDNNAPVSFTAVVGNSRIMNRALVAGSTSGHTLINPGAVPNNEGNSVIVRPSLPGPFVHDWIEGGITTHATLQHTAATVDAYVWYGSDADVALMDARQAGLTVPA
jgi:hypothetical protein